jgi:hypothetical protein
VRQIRFCVKVVIREVGVQPFESIDFAAQRLKFREIGRISSLMTCQDGGIGV